MLSEAPPPSGLLRARRLKPLVDWLFSRSRKLLPRLATVAFAETAELATVGVGLGVAVGVGPGSGLGNTCWACAAGTRMNANSMAATTARSSARPGGVVPAREGHGERRMRSSSK